MILFLPVLRIFAMFGLPLVAPASEPTVLSATITLRDIELKELFEKLKVDPGYLIEGKVTVIAKIATTLGEATTLGSYVLQGTVSSGAITLEKSTVRDLSAELNFEKGKLTLKSLTASIPGEDSKVKAGQLRGSATAQVEPRGDLTASLKLADVPLGTVLRAIPGLSVSTEGSVTGSIDFKSPFDKLGDASAWEGSADLTSAALKVSERTALDARVKLAVKAGVAKGTDVSATVEGLPVKGDFDLALNGKYAYSARINTVPSDRTSLAKLAPEFNLPFDVRGKLESKSSVAGTLTPLTATASGNITVKQFALGDAPDATLTAKWKVTPELAVVSDLSVELFDGKVTGSADIPLATTAKGKFDVDFKTVDAAALAKAFPKVPVKLKGRITGDLKGTIPAAKADASRTVKADLKLSADKLTVQGIASENLSGTIGIENDVLKYQLEGKTLGGSFTVEGSYSEEKPKAKDNGSVILRHLDFGRLANGLGFRSLDIRGVLDLNLQHSGDLSNGDGRYTIRGLGYGSATLLSELSGRLRIRNGQFELVDSIGPVTAGTLRARVRASLSQPARNYFRIDIDRADLNKLLLPFTGRNEFMEGGVSLSLGGKVWPEFRATGSIGLSRGRIGGMTASNVRIPVDVSATGSGGKVTIRQASGTFGDGRASGNFEYQWGATARVEGDVKFTNVRIGNVLKDIKQSNYFGTARITGRLEIKGENIATFDDLTGSALMTIQQAGVRELPVLDVVLPFVSASALLEPFDEGELRGRLSRGVFRIERLALANSTSDLFADGTVTRAGKLDLSLVIRTGDLGLNQSVLGKVGLLPSVFILPLPLTVVQDVTAILANRTVRLKVTGSLDSPQAQVNGTALLADEAIRYLLRKYFPLAIPLSGAVQRSNR